MWPWRKRLLLCVPRSIFRKGVAVPTGPKPFPIFLQLAPQGRHCDGTFRQRSRANLRYKKRCTFGFISLEHLPHGNLRFKDGNPNSRMTSFCTIEYGSGNTERRCGRAAVAECGHCGASVCSSCAKECCAQVLCGYCYDYHVIHSCLRSAPPTEFRLVPMAFRPAPHRYAV